MTIPETDREKLEIESTGMTDVVGLLVERVTATAALTRSLVALAAAEARLALNSAGLMALFSIALIIMLPITWLVMLATAFHALMALGVSPLGSAALLLALQLSICGLIAFTIYRLSRLMAFSRTREALGELTADSTAPTSDHSINKEI